MNTQKASQDDARGTSPHPQGAARTGPADGQSAEEMKAHGDRHAIAQAARAVMHPERYDLEWRFYHGAVNG